MTTRAISRARDERGNVLVIALVVMALLLTFGLALLNQVDTQQEQGGIQRARESSFQVAEGALNGQIFQLSTRWPDSTAPYPSSCTQGTMGQQDCPGTNAMSSTFTNVDQAKSTAWTTQVRDNDALQPNYWSDSLLSGNAYDANGDGYVWVRSTALINGRRRTVVALIKAEQTMIPPAGGNHTLVAGFFMTTNNGNKVIVDTNGTDNQFAGDIVVRCTFADSKPPENGCAQYDSGKGQVEPERVFSNPTEPNLSTDRIEAARTQAKADGNYYLTGCAPNLAGDKPGETVFMENATNCKYNGNSDYNTHDKPGAVVIAKGTIEILGNASFYGVIYHLNLAQTNQVLIDLGGNCSIVGAISVDGGGGVNAGSSKVNVVFDPNVWPEWEGIATRGTASIVPNTFREISATS